MFTKAGIVTLNQVNIYNGNGQRVEKSENGQSTKYYYQNDSVLYTTGKADTSTELEEPDVVEKLTGVTSLNLMGSSGNAIATVRDISSTEGEKHYFYNKDMRESTTNLVNVEGKSEVAYDYDDFGVTTTIGDSSFFDEVCYTGGIYDVSTGLYYLNVRYYDPQNGRFITQDTYRGELNKPDTQHLYVYCTNNPINYVDPSGDWIETVIDVVSTGYSLATFMKKPPWLNAGYLIWDVGATLIPFLSGSYVKRSGKLVVKVADKVSDFRSKKKGLPICPTGT